MTDCRQAGIPNSPRPALGDWLGRAGWTMLAAAFGLAGTWAAGWLTGAGPVERLVTLPVALGLLLWLLVHLGREIAIAVAAWRPRRAVCRRGARGEDALFILLGMASTAVPGPGHWLALALLPVLGALVRRPPAVDVAG